IMQVTGRCGTEVNPPVRSSPAAIQYTAASGEGKMGAEAQPDMSGADPAEPGRVTLSGGPALRMVARGVCGVPKLGPDGRQQRACAAIRVSEGKQADGYSPSTQRAAILARAHAHGYLMDECDLYEDHQRGHVLTRKGYVAILGAVRDGKY